MLRSLFTCYCMVVAGWAAGQDFRVQIAAYADSMPSAYFKDHGVEQYTVSHDQMGIYRYFAGAYKTRDEADKMKDLMVGKGFPYAYVIDLEEQRILCGAGCPYFRNGVIFVKDSSQDKTVRNIYFDFGRYSLTLEAKEVLNEMLPLLKSNTKSKLVIKGYTDAVGSAKANVVLATNRSRSARNYLIAKGIRADRMFIKVFGESDPAAPNKDDEDQDSPENRKFNRRVVLAITDETGEIK